MTTIRTVCPKDKCTGCSACVNICNRKAIHVIDSIQTFNAQIDENICVNCRMCEQICPNNSPIKKKHPIEWFQGWATNESVRRTSSSGGVATAIATGFVKNGGIVCSCKFLKGEFIFDFAYSQNDIQKFSGSKYIKSNPKEIFKNIKKLIKENKKVLLIGLPCQIAAAKNFVNNNPLLYTIDLICHGTPSPKILKMFLREKGINITRIHNVNFRNKTNFHLSYDTKPISPPTVMDMYTFSFLNGICYTENCYSCQYATINRTGDISLGDSWGSSLAQDEIKKGISLILCQTEHGKELLNNAELQLFDVNLDNAITYNKQLKQPSTKPSKYNLFYFVLKKTHKFGLSTFVCFPLISTRFMIKSIIVRLAKQQRHIKK